MPAPYTAFTYGDPHIDAASITNGSIWLPSLLGFTFNNGTKGNAYAQQFTPTGAGMITVAVTSGSLPPGLSLSAVTAMSPTWQVSGVPTVAGTYSFTLTATGTNGSSSQSFSILILSAGGTPVTLRPSPIIRPM